ncbi:MAG: porin [Rhodospirillales bacterium]|nr:porin [Rhodospirillales bacterium]MDE0711616.1 porin [Rhodospirillales bacterium]
MSKGRWVGRLASAAGLLIVCSVVPAAADDGRSSGLGTLHFGSSDVVPCALRTHRIGGGEESTTFVHPSPTCEEGSASDIGWRARKPFETTAAWSAGYSELDIAVGVVYRALPPSITTRERTGRETVSLVGALQYGRFVLGAGVFDADDPAIDNVRRGYNLGANYRFGAFRVGTSLITTWTDGSWTGRTVNPANQRSLDSLSVDLEYAFKPGLRGYFNYVEVSHPEQLASWQAQSGQRESTWSIGVSVGF